jgi:hypothetical protein
VVDCYGRNAAKTRGSLLKARILSGELAGVKTSGKRRDAVRRRLALCRRQLEFEIELGIEELGS